MTPEELLALYEDPERRRKAENATRDRTLLAGLAEAYAQSQEPYGAKYHELSGQNAMLAAQQPVKAFEREQEGLSGALNANRAQEQLQLQQSANEAARADRLASREQEQSQFERLLAEREAERVRKEAQDAAHLEYLYANMKRKAAKGKSGGSALTKNQQKTAGLDEITAQIDQMDLTPAQRALAVNAQKTGDIVTLRGIIQDEAKIQADRADQTQGKASVADYDQIISMADKLLSQYDEKSGKYPEGLGGDIGTRGRYIDVPDYPLISAIAKGASNIVASKAAQGNRQLNKNLSDEIRKEKYGSSFTGGEKGEFGELSGQEATADPITRINFLRQIRERALRQKAALSAPRRNAASNLAAAPNKIRVREKATGQTGTLDSMDEFDPNLYELIK